MTKYTKIEVDLDKCRLSTVLEIFINSKIKKPNDAIQKKRIIEATILLTISEYSNSDFKKRLIEEFFKNAKKES